MVQGYIDKMAKYNGGTRAGVRIQASEISARELVIAVQKHVATPEQWRLLHDLAREAAKLNPPVIVRIIEIS